MLDQADILSAAEETKIDQQLRALWQRNGDALVVVSVKSLEGEAIEDYSVDLASAWGIGDSKTNRGILLLVAPTERKVRIEVACGLQGIVSDVTAGRIIRNTIVPLFRSGDLARGTQAGVDSLIKTLDLRKPANDFGLPPPPCPTEAKVAA